MKAVQYDSARNFDLVDVADPDPGAEDVVIEVAANGVCHTDVNVHEGEFFATFPLIPGHEVVGTVVDKGREVPRGIAIGARMMVNNASTCGHCYYCRRGQPLFCENFYSLGINGPGGAAEFIRVHYAKTVPIADWLTFEQAVIAEPLACAIHGMDQVGLRLADRVLIFGAGPSGQLLAQLAKWSGASQVVVVAPGSAKLDLAASLKAADVTLPITRDHPEEVRPALTELAPQGFSVVIDTTGAAGVLEQAVEHVHIDGRLLVYGMARFRDRVAWSPYDIFRHQIHILGSFAQIDTMERAAALLASGKIDLPGLITHRFGLDEYGRALDNVARGIGIKTVIIPHRGG